MMKNFLEIKRCANSDASFFLMKFTGFRLGQLVAEFVVLRAHVAFCPVEPDLVAGNQKIQRFPEVLVQHVASCLGFPAVSLPVGNPVIGKAFLQILAVRMESHLVPGSVIDDFERFIGRPKLHAVIRAYGLASSHIEQLFSQFVEENRRKTAGTIGIDQAGTIGENGEFLRQIFSIRKREIFLTTFLEGYFFSASGRERGFPEEGEPFSEGAGATGFPYHSSASFLVTNPL